MPSCECFVGKEPRKHMVANTLGMCMCTCDSSRWYLTGHSCLMFVVCSGWQCECGNGSQIEYVFVAGINGPLA